MVRHVPRHGGARSGAGRKAGSGSFGEPTQLMRVPESQVPAITTFLDAYRSEQALEGVRVAATHPINPRRQTRLPLMGYRVPAGVASPADDYIEEQIDLNEHLIRKGHEEATFIVTASGWSMIGAGIHDGDEIIVDRAIDPVDGHIVVAAIDGELVVKRLRIRAGTPVLVSENPHYPERVIAEGERFEIWGVATRVLHKL